VSQVYAAALLFGLVSSTLSAAGFLLWSRSKVLPSAS
jgi:hypothetical protein